MRSTWQIIHWCLFFVAGFASRGYATHVVGGEVTYEYVGMGGPPEAPYQYHIVFNVYIDRVSNYPTGVQPDLTFGVYFAGTNQLIQQLIISSSARDVDPVLPANCNIPSIQNIQVTLNTYEATVNLPFSADGYRVIYERCCRNVVQNILDYENTGNTFYAFIASPSLPNSSPVFTEIALPFLCVGDTAVVANNATDPDGDRLEYAFERPYTGGTQDFPAPDPPPVFNFPPKVISYNAGFSPSRPFGANSFATIDSKTGIARYFAPQVGRYAVAVEVKEFRTLSNGTEVLVGVIRRELQFAVGDCLPNEQPQFAQKNLDTLAYAIHAGDKLCFGVSAFDNKDVLSISASGDIIDGTNGYSGPRATFAQVTRLKEASTEFCWQTDCHTPLGNYSVKVKATDEGCPPKTNIVIYNITVLESQSKPVAPVITADGSTNLCPGGSVRLSVPAQPGTTYQWKKDGADVGANLPNFTVTGAGIYTVSLTNDCGTVASSNQMNVTALSLPDAPAIVANGTAVFCESGSVELSLVSPLVVGDVTYQWKRDGTPVGTNSPAFVATATGEYLLELTDACQHTVVSNAVVVRVKARPPAPGLANPGHVSRCGPGSLTLVANGGSNGNYRWYDSATGGTALAGQTGNTFTTPPLSATQTYAVALVEDGCESERLPITATIDPLPPADAGSDVSILLGEQTQLRASGGDHYEWSPVAGLDNPNVASPVAKPDRSTTYVLTVTSANGCTATDEVTVDVRLDLNIPNTISPNNDGVNDTWDIQNIDLYQSCRVVVFNRWGEKIFESVGYATPWNGKYKSGDLPVSTYFYQIDLNDGRPPLMGSVSIVR